MNLQEIAMLIGCDIELPNGIKSDIVASTDFGYLQLSADRKCSDTGINWLVKGRKWLLSPHMVRSEVVSTIFKAVMTFEEHEIRERFLYKGKAIYGPHLDVEALLSVADQTESRKAPVSLDF